MGSRAVRCGVLAALLGVLGGWASAGAAQAEPVWVEGTIQETNILSCIQNIPENGTGAFLAYQEPAPSTPPEVGQVYYVAVTVSGLGNTCSGTIYNPQLKLPAGTQPAVSTEYPVYCFASPRSGAPMEEVSNMCAGIETLPNGNVQIDSTSAWAGTFNGQPVAPFFPIAQGYFEEENIPVVSTLPLSGGQKIESAIETTDEGGQTLRPWVAPVVDAAPAPGPEGGGGGTGTPSTPPPTVPPSPSPVPPAPTPTPGHEETTPRKHHKKHHKRKHRHRHRHRQAGGA